MAQLFDPFKLAGLNLPNRSVRSATWEGLADANGFVQPELVRLIAALARGSVGLVIPGYLYIRPDGRGLPWQTGAWDDRHIDGLSRIAKTVHDEGGLVCAQIAHAGGRTRSEWINGERPIAPSAVKGFSFGSTPRRMTISEIEQVAGDFSKAASRVKQAGFDAVQLHAAHNYLLSQFLNPLINRRTDRYGGSAQKRRRFLIEVYEAVRKAVGMEFPVLIKLNTTDGPEGGVTWQEALDTAKELASRGLDAVEVSGGMAGSNLYRASRKGISNASQEAYFRPAAKFFKPELDIPLILVGGIKSYEVASDIIEKGDADLVSFSRSLICEPGLILRWSKGDTSGSKCLSCNLCLEEGLKGGGIRCAGENSNKGTMEAAR